MLFEATLVTLVLCWLLLLNCSERFQLFSFCSRSDWRIITFCYTITGHS